MLVSAIRIVGLFAAGASTYVMVRVLWPDVRRAWRRKRWVRRIMERQREQARAEGHYVWPALMPRWGIPAEEIQAAIDALQEKECK